MSSNSIEKEIKTIIDFKKVDEIFNNCKSIFLSKINTYGVSFDDMEQTTFTDLLYIKVKRLKSIYKNEKNFVGEDTLNDWYALINYSILALIKIESKIDKIDLNAISINDYENMYNNYTKKLKSIIINKTRDYGDAWVDLRDITFIDLILNKVKRIINIENLQKENREFNEAILDNYIDVANYSILFLYKKIIKKL